MPSLANPSCLAPVAVAPIWGERAPCGLVACTTKSDDADEHASKLTGWSQRYDQLGAGRFEGRISELRLPSMQVFRESTNRALRQSCRVWSDSFWFGLPDARSTCHPSIAGTRINGRAQGVHDVMVRPGDEAFELLTPDHHSLFGIVVQRDALIEAAQTQACRVDWGQLALAHVLRADGAAYRTSVSALESLLPDTEGAQAQVPMSTSVASLQSVLLSMLVAMLDTSEVEARARQSTARRQRVVALAHEHVLSHPDQHITVPELCAQLHVSRRTLQYCFEDVMGLSPIQYLRAIRLNGARRHLRQAAGSGRSVQDVASHWGFWHLSQFGADYRRLFGESPSETRRGSLALGAG